MKIAMLTQSYPPMVSGAALFTRNLAQAIVNRGHQVLVITASEREKPYRVEAANLTTLHLPSHHNPLRVGQRFILSQNARIKAALSEYEPDLLHLHDPLQLAWAAASYSRGAGIPCILTIHALPALAAANFPVFQGGVEYGLWIYAGWLLQQVQARVVPTRTIADIVYAKTGLSSQVISCGVDLNTFSPERLSIEVKARMRKNLGIPDASPVILYVGRLDADKKVNLAIMAASRAMQLTPAHLLVVGNGRMQASLIHLCDRLGIRSRSHFTGYITDPNELSVLYRLASVFITASECETQGLVLLEAAASGLPLVGVDSGAIGETVHDGINGYLIQPGDVNSLTQAIVRILSNVELARDMRRASIEVARQHDFKLTRQAYDAFYQALIAQNENLRNF